jgi:uncharacterized membrane protein
VAIVAFAVWWFASGPFDPNAPHVNLNMTNGNGYSSALNGSPNYHYECTLTNSGTITARNVRLIVHFFGTNHMAIGTETSTVGDIPAGTSKNVSIDVPCPTQTTSTEVTLQYDI